jgi:PAS domain S-box-containing protein
VTRQQLPEDEVHAELTALRDRVEVLRRSEELYRAVVQAQTEMVTRFRPDFVLTFVNDAACRALQLSREQVLGKSFLPLLPEEDRGWVSEKIASLTREQSVCSFDHQVVLPDGERGWTHWTNRALFDERGQLVEYQGSGRDITLRKRAEVALERRNEELARANQELQRLHREKDALIAMVSHELRTPLVTGIGYLEMLLSGAFGPITEKAAAKMQIARRNLGRLAQLIEDLLDYQRLLLGTGRKLGVVAVDLGELLEEVRADTIVARGVEPSRVGLDVPPGLALASANRGMLRRAITNLLDNALLHAGAGCRVQLKARAEADGRLWVCVSDDGVGIAPELKDRIFDLFVKADESSEGRGLGLAIVRAILHAHGAQIDLRSEAGRGTEVAFRLQPAHDDAPVPALAKTT